MPLPVIDADVAAIAKGLTEAQRRLLCTRFATLGGKELASGYEADLNRHQIGPARRLERAGLLRFFFADRWERYEFTPLGLLVREHLARTGAPE